MMASLIYPLPISAEIWPDAGVFLGYRWGGEQGNGFEWGLEGGVLNIKNFDSVHGGYLQVAFQNLKTPTIVALYSGGPYSGGLYPAQAELGIAYRFGEHQGFGLHLGVTGELIGNVGIRYKTYLDDLSLNLGIRGVKQLN